jgi:hypothetical protein
VFSSTIKSYSTYKIDGAASNFVSDESVTAACCRFFGRKGVHYELGQSLERVHGTFLDAFQPFSSCYPPISNSYTGNMLFLVLRGLGTSELGKRQSSTPLHSVAPFGACSATYWGKAPAIPVSLPPELDEQWLLLSPCLRGDVGVWLYTAIMRITLSSSACLSVSSHAFGKGSSYSRISTVKIGRAVVAFGSGVSVVTAGCCGMRPRFRPLCAHALNCAHSWCLARHIPIVPVSLLSKLDEQWLLLGLECPC